MSRDFFRADQFAQAQNPADKEQQSQSQRSTGSSFFKKKTARRAKSLGKDHWDEVIFCEYQIMEMLARTSQSFQPNMKNNDVQLLLLLLSAPSLHTLQHIHIRHSIMIIIFIYSPISNVYKDTSSVDL